MAWKKCGSWRYFIPINGVILSLLLTGKGAHFVGFLLVNMVVCESSGGPKTTKNGFWIRWLQGMLPSAGWSQSFVHLGGHFMVKLWGKVGVLMV